MKALAVRLMGGGDGRGSDSQYWFVYRRVVLRVDRVVSRGCVID